MLLMILLHYSLDKKNIKKNVELSIHIYDVQYDTIFLL